VQLQYLIQMDETIGSDQLVDQEAKSPGNDRQLEVYAGGIDKAIQRIKSGEKFEANVNKQQMSFIIGQIATGSYNLECREGVFRITQLVQSSGIDQVSSPGIFASSVELTPIMHNSGIDEKKAKEKLRVEEAEAYIKAIPNIQVIETKNNKDLMTVAEIKNCVHSASTYVMVDSDALKKAKTTQERLKTVFKIGQTSELLPHERVKTIRWAKRDIFVDTKYQMILVSTFNDSDPAPYPYDKLHNGHDFTFYEEVALFKKRHSFSISETSRSGQGDETVSKIFHELVDEHPEDVKAIMNRLVALLEDPEPKFVGSGVYLCKFGCKPSNGTDGWTAKEGLVAHMWKNHYNGLAPVNVHTMKVLCPCCIPLMKKSKNAVVGFQSFKSHLIQTHGFSTEAATKLRKLILKTAHGQYDRHKREIEEQIVEEEQIGYE